MQYTGVGHDDPELRGRLLAEQYKPQLILGCPKLKDNPKAACGHFALLITSLVLIVLAAMNVWELTPLGNGLLGAGAAFLFCLTCVTCCCWRRMMDRQAYSRDVKKHNEKINQPHSEATSVARQVVTLLKDTYKNIDAWSTMTLWVVYQTRSSSQKVKTEQVSKDFSVAELIGFAETEEFIKDSLTSFFTKPTDSSNKNRITFVFITKKPRESIYDLTAWSFSTGNGRTSYLMNDAKRYPNESGNDPNFTRIFKELKLPSGKARI